ncbi:MAG: hypothetical protein E7253_00835 [Lachnospiraceae bacterium]|nr:hypothetical protein [Lachnospiraceae bacterium]
MEKNAKIKSKSEKKLATYFESMESRKAFEKLSEESGVKISELRRMADKEFLDNGCNRPIEIFNLIMLTQKLQDMKERQTNNESVMEKDYAECQQYLSNIMSIKGGK